MTKFVPFGLINNRIDVAKEDSDTLMFMQLMYAAEQLTKIVVVGLLACVEDDKQRHRYTLEHRLVKADGIGEWSSVLDEILIGPTSSLLCPGIKPFQKEMVEASKAETWQFESVKLINDCLKIIDNRVESIPTKTQAKNWYSLFARLRNKTRGHGAVGSNDFSAICPLLFKSLELQVENISLFKFSWVYLRQNLNCKYRVSEISNSSAPFEYLKSDRSQNLAEGVYIHVDGHRIVKLMFSTPELSDFYFPNGNFGNNTFECISYISDDKIYPDVSLYGTPPGELPKSQTEGRGELDLIGDTWTNIPVNPIVYINREELEKELLSILNDERHPVVTLVGRGGIGKTSLAISVLQKICLGNKFPIIVWLSARDIDLLVEGVKPVKPNVLSISDISKEFCELLGIKVLKGGATAKDLMEEQLVKSSFDGPILFVLDNFETVVNPREVYSWLNTFIRLPNKILITSRYRDFKGDYHIEVHGMNEPEFKSLVAQVSIDIGIPDVAHDEKYVKDLYTQSDGHPYVAKILLGELLKQNGARNVKMILAGKDDILTALFERTYTHLTPIAKRIFLTVSNWRSIIPEVAIEAILLSGQNEPIDVEEAISELAKSSLIETIKSETDNSYFVYVPLSAALFGKKKLSVDPLKVAIEADTIRLHAFGVGTMDEVKLGLKPKAEKLFRDVAKKIDAGKSTLEASLPILKFICGKYHDSWINLSALYEEEGNIAEAISSLQNYLEAPTSNENAAASWNKLTKLFAQQGNWQGEVHALVEYCLVPNIPFSDLSNAANAINKLFTVNKHIADALEKRISIEKVTVVFERRIGFEGKGDDYSRLAWLLLNINEVNQALAVVDKGLLIDTGNPYCLKLKDKIMDTISRV